MFTMVTFKVTIVNIENILYTFDMSVKYHHGDLKKASVEEAIKLIQERNEASFTLRELAAKLNVSHTALYRHFKSKQAVLSAVAETGFIKMSSAFEKAVSIKNINSRFRYLGQSYIQFALDNPGYYRAMFHGDLRCADEGDRMARTELEEAGNKTFLVLVDILATGMKSKAFKKGDPAIIARSVWSSMHGFCILFLDGQFQGLIGKSKELKQAVEDHLRFIELSIQQN